MPNYKRINWAIVVSGLVLCGAQGLVIRRALTLSGGDEQVFALTLAVWLVFVSAGSALGIRLSRSNRNARRLFAGGLLGMSLAAPFSLAIMPLIAAKMGWIAGTVAGMGGLLVALITGLSVPAFAGGVLFPLAARALSASPNPISRVYWLEALGSGLGGLLLSLVFLPHLDLLSLSCFFLGAGGALSLVLLWARLPIWIALVGAGMVVGLLQPLTARWERAILSALHPGQEILELKQTPYGQIEVTGRAGQVTVLENGLTVAVSDDPSGAEEQAYLLSVMHPHPRRVLWIGGLLGDAPELALRDTSLQQLDIIELNPEFFSLASWFPEAEDLKQYPRVKLIQGDGRDYLRRTSEKKYDLIALNLPGPRTVRLAKFYTVEGFQEIKRALKPEGLLVFSIESSEDFIGKDLALLLASLRATLAQVFDQVEVYPGEKAIFVAGQSAARIAGDVGEIISRLNPRHVVPVYWDQHRLRDRFSSARVSKFRSTIGSIRDPLINRDAQPISFYFQQILWSRQIRGGWAGLIRPLRQGVVEISLGIIALSLLAGLFLRHLRGPKRVSIGIGWAVSLAGFSGMVLEILALNAYQIHFGSGYREIGLLVGGYMAGLGGGAYLCLRRSVTNLKLVLYLQSLWIIFPVILLALFWISAEMIQGIAYLGPLVYCLGLVLLGALGGGHFNAAVGYTSGAGMERGARLYALDLLGASVGALTIGWMVLPLVGITACALGLSLLNLAPLIILIAKPKRGN